MKKRVYFFKQIKKVRIATEKIRREMRARGSATGAELAAATGLSLVTIYKELAELISRGEMRENPQNAPSGGGRPPRVYECEAGYAVRALVSAAQQGGITHLDIEVMDLQGRRLRHAESSWVRPELSAVEAWLEDALRRRRVAGIALALSPLDFTEELCERLRQRHRCPVSSICPAAALADGREDTATLYLRRGEAPLCSLWRRGQVFPTGALGLLPLPVAWEALDYTDHTLVEEMIARLLQALACVLAPSRMVVHADFWSTRLVERIRFNTQSKLKGRAPELVFRMTSPHAVEAAMRRSALSL